ncbi:MAG: hypothetical protein PHP69_06930 [Candidatus Omnitrophica bacterium]|nr:hypothetical protein [Candidatus Omnitrophota bacterium]
MKKTCKQKWQKPEMTRIKLNPEQAVLSCCDAGQKLIITELTGIMFQCMTESQAGNCGGSGGAYSSS